MEKFIEYAPIIIVILGFFIAYNIFVTPAQMEKAIALLKEHISENFVSKETNNVVITNLQNDMNDMKEKINKIYDFIILGKKD